MTRGRMKPGNMREKLHGARRWNSVLLPVLISVFTINGQAAVLTVSSAADSGPGSLRLAISSASDHDPLNFSPALRGSKINLAAPLFIDRSLTIQGLGADQLEVN